MMLKESLALPLGQMNIVVVVPEGLQYGGIAIQRTLPQVLSLQHSRQASMVVAVQSCHMQDWWLHQMFPWRQLQLFLRRLSTLFALADAEGASIISSVTGDVDNCCNQTPSA